MAVSFVLALAATAFALIIFVLVVRNDLLDWVGGIFGSGYARHARLLASLPQAERSLEQSRFIIADAFSMVDRVERKYRNNRRGTFLEVLIREETAYYRIADELSEATRDMVHNPVPGLRVHSALMAGGQERREDQILRMLRSDIAAIEKRWGLRTGDHSVVNRID